MGGAGTSVGSEESEEESGLGIELVELHKGLEGERASGGLDGSFLISREDELSELSAFCKKKNVNSKYDGRD